MPDPVSTALGLRPGKVIAVHLNYPSRAAQRGRTPRHGSYFLKAPSSLAADGGEVARPEGTELLAFEGEVALVIGTRARAVSPEDGWSHVGWVSAANDLGLYDLRHADAGSNLRAKSGDGFTPIGPNFLPAADLDPAGLRVRTWVNGELVQSDTTDTLLFPFGQLVADLSRLSTLEPGDVILTGTPAGASVVEPGDLVEVEVDNIAPGRPASTGRLRTTVVAGPPLAGWGAAPKVDDGLRAAAFGTEVPEDGPGDATIQRLTTVAVATLSAQLRSRGLNNVHVEGVRAARAGARFAGRAKTLRYLPLREDLFRERGGGYNAQKRAMDSVGPGEVLVIEARGVPDSGTVGDILALRAQVRGAVGIVTDGGLRDSQVVAGLDIPVFHGATHPAVLGRRHVPWESDVAIGCGGTTVCPGDVVVGDDDGVLVIPPSLVEEVLAAAIEQERQEEFITEQVRAGEGIDGLYPLGPDWQPAYREWLRKRNGDDQ
ncbi:fumarylacetoacetate hydrolase family protein [Pseudonocardia acaciae]|uniref:fumarylacetoacetate hydrolase family protein n=1 Tax=Pseudonocardia acaciae TaxID=551276 RepID=UPI000491DD7A|nr:fumarylacetoacetate hydrolase family protein [Pseudonocardia acaciae]